MLLVVVVVVVVGCCRTCWAAPAEAIGSVRGAVSGVGVGWAELRIAGGSEVLVW